MAEALAGYRALYARTLKALDKAWLGLVRDEKSQPNPPLSAANK